MLSIFVSMSLAAGLIGREASPQTQPAASEIKKTSPQQMSEAIDKLVELKADSYQVLLRDASLLVPPLLKGQEWSDIQQLMLRHRFAVIEAWENGDAVHSHYLVKKRAIILPSGDTLDLQLHCSAWNLDRPRCPARPGKLYAADVVLVSEIAEAHLQALKDRKYPRGTILDAILGYERLAKEGERWPLLSRISVHYGYILNHHLEYNPSGFHVTVEFIASTREEIGGRQMYFYAASGLDPLQSWDMKEKLLDGFKPRDIITDIAEGGSNEWWQGEPDTIEANKRKYLNKAD